MIMLVNELKSSKITRYNISVAKQLMLWLCLTTMS